jgi:hypothetical protein
MPYDFDRAFVVNGNWDPTGNSMTGVDRIPITPKAIGGDKYNVNPL